MNTYWLVIWFHVTGGHTVMLQQPMPSISQCYREAGGVSDKARVKCWSELQTAQAVYDGNCVRADLLRGVKYQTVDQYVCTEEFE